MPRKPPLRRSRRPPPPPNPSPTEEVPPERARDLADRRDLPAEGHVNVGPDDRSSGHYDDIEAEGSERVADVDTSVIETVASHVDAP